MNPILASRTTLAITILLAFSSAAAAQTPSCAYTFTWPQYQFSFCVSQYGTLAMLQAPIGVNQLDATTPIEGYVYYFDIEGNDNYFGGCQVPNLPGVCFPQVASFTQPKGPGTLPLIAYDGVARTTFTANPAQRQVIIYTSIDIGVHQGAHFLQLEREGAFQPGANAMFSSTVFGPYAVSKDGLSLTTKNGCFGNYAGLPPGFETSNGADTCASSSFTGTGTMYAVKNSSSPRFANLQVQYSIF